MEPVSNTAENNHGDSSFGQVLLRGNVLINRDEDVKTGGLGSIRQATVFQARKVGIPNRLAVVIGKQ